VGVTCEDKATQWEESVEADPSLDKPSGANSRGQAVRKGGEQRTPAASGPLNPDGLSATCCSGSAMSLAGLPIRDHDPAQPVAEGKRGHIGTGLRGWGNHHDNGGGNGKEAFESYLQVEMWRGGGRRIVVYLPTFQPEEEDPGSRDASVQVGVTCEDKATQ
ncbi:UNVERIFIED_CONTAM: hypothetical protein K2H54_009973, partial [Gekko kuhli]